VRWGVPRVLLLVRTWAGKTGRFWARQLVVEPVPRLAAVQQLISLCARSQCSGANVVMMNTVMNITIMGVTVAGVTEVTGVMIGTMIKREKK